jgi:hypothetical protein
MAMISTVHRWTCGGAEMLGLMLSQLAGAAFAPNAEAARPPEVGTPAPNFTATRADGTPYVLRADHLRQPYVLIFYRGSWCPSVFIVDSSGVIRFVYSNTDFRVRLSAYDLWKAALPLAPKPIPGKRL